MVFVVPPHDMMPNLINISLLPCQLTIVLGSRCAGIGPSTNNLIY